ncbi:MAG: hypothetical protein LBT86_03050 [Deltaproteobacteria bacterium]|nr:hypothetical protein [Deltaproteobacteria bacterium]
MLGLSGYPSLKAGGLTFGFLIFGINTIISDEMVGDKKIVDEGFWLC